jgi:hypothetical protein
LELLEKEVYDGAGRHSCPAHVELPWNLDDDLSASGSSSPLSDTKIAAQLARWGITYQLHPNTSKVRLAGFGHIAMRRLLSHGRVACKRWW